MPIIERSNKLSLTQAEYRICSAPYVFYRVIINRSGGRLMTATASEKAGEYRAFEDQKSLISAAIQVFGDFDMKIAMKEDHAGRSYVETPVSSDAQHFIHVATIALERMGFEDVSVLALREMNALYDEYAIDSGGEDTYLRDGMWVKSDGRLIEK